jgi:hypothetical protein
MRKTRKDGKIFSSDLMMRNVASSLVRDFQNALGDHEFCSGYRSLLKGGAIPVVRSATPAPSEGMDTYAYKAMYQIQSLFKRYRFSDDTYSDEELKEKSVKTFLETQSRLRTLDLQHVDSITQRVVDCAKLYISKVLGKYSDEEHRNLCRFGRRASVGIPARDACEAARWELPISGSQSQISWFDSEMSQIACVQSYWARQLESDPHRSIYQETDFLTLTLVPKTFKSLRSIMPNTTIGSYMSFGLGNMIRKRLKREGYDISKLQMKHRYYAQSASIHGQWVTADLSSASDSISDDLVRLLFPKDWYSILSQSRIAQVKLPDGSIVQSLTHCTMGVGYTFPLQTLVFLALLKAIDFVCFPRRGDRRLVSVYGDDLLYHRRIHDTVLHVFTALGFVINVDKTFSDGSFRESCGGDYYRGVDVRPFQPQNGQTVVGSKAYEAMLYKCINGLLMRWTEHEIRGTLHYLVTELERVAGAVKRVPPTFPDDSGVKCAGLCVPSFLEHHNVSHPRHVGHGMFRFPYLRFITETKEETRHEPYLWLWLHHGVFDLPWHEGNPIRRDPSETPTQRLIDLIVGVKDTAGPFILKESDPHSRVRSCLTGLRLRRVSTHVAISHTGRYVRQSGISGFEIRR